MDENPFASGDDDDDDEDNNNNNNNNLMPPPTRNDSINNNKKEQFNNNNGMEQNTARASNSNNSSMLITKKTSLWGDNDDDDDDDTNTNTNTNNSKVKKNKKEDEDGQKNNNDSNFFGDEDVVDITAQNVVVASSFLSAKNDPLSQMASYHEQTSYSFHGSIMQDDNLASPLAAFETFIPGSKSALSKREEEEIASMSARKKEGSDSMKEVELQDRSGDKNEAKVVDEIVEIQLDEEDEEEQKQNRRYYKAAESERFNSPFNKSVSATATTTTTAPTLASSSSDFEPPPPSYADSVMYANPAIQPGNSMMMMMNSTAPAMMRAETFDSSMQQQPLLLPEQQQQQQSIYTQLQQRQQQQQMSGSLSPQFQFYPPYDPSKDETLVNPGDEKKTELIAYISEAKTESEFNQQGGAGLSKKVTRYKINFKTNSEKFMQKEAIVWRRFSDFVQLHDRLLESHRGYFIPPRPEKSIKRLGDEAFVQSRKLMLQNYLEKLIKHPSLRSSSLALKVFLTQQDLHQSREWHALATPSTTSIPPSSLLPGYQQHEQVQQSSPSMQFAPDSHMMASSPIGGINPTSPMGAAASNGGSAIFTQQNVSASMMMTSPTPVSSHATAAPAVSPNSRSSVGKFFRELRQSMATSSAVVAVGGAFGIESAKPKIVEEDAQFLVDKEKSTKLETELCGLSLKTEKILQREEKFADSLGAFGLECMKFARVEEEASGISGRYSEPGTRLATAAQIFRKVGNASVRASRIARAATVQLAKAMDPLHAHLNLMPSVRRATQLRAETLLSLQTLLSDQERLTIRISKLAPDITKHAKIEQLKRELEETNRLAENARREYDCIRARQSNEFARSEKERVEDFSSMLLGLARVQVAQAERTLSVWRNLAEELGASPEEWSETLNSPTPPEKVDGEDLQR